MSPAPLGTVTAEQAQWLRPSETYSSSPVQFKTKTEKRGSRYPQQKTAPKTQHLRRAYVIVKDLAISAGTIYKGQQQGDGEAGFEGCSHVHMQLTVCLPPCRDRGTGKNLLKLGGVGRFTSCCASNAVKQAASKSKLNTASLPAIFLPRPMGWACALAGSVLGTMTCRSVPASLR